MDPLGHTGPVQADLASRKWSTPVTIVIFGWVLVGAAALWWLTSNTGSDRVFIGMVFLALAVITGYGTVCRPRLRADADGIAIRGLRGTQRWTWPQVTVTVERNQRLGLATELLQVDVVDTDYLIVLSRLDLGEAPHDVAQALTTLRTV
jgi:hypothetical protein